MALAAKPCKGIRLAASPALVPMVKRPVVVRMPCVVERAGRNVLPNCCRSQQLCLEGCLCAKRRLHNNPDGQTASGSADQPDCGISKVAPASKRFLKPVGSIQSALVRWLHAGEWQL